MNHVSTLPIHGPDLLAPLSLMVLVWILSLLRRDASLADIAWGPAIALVPLWHALTVGLHTRGALVLAPVLAWAARLAWHIARRHRGEDPRYREMRRKGGRGWPLRSLVTVFGLQALLAWVVARPAAAALRLPVEGLGVWDVAGIGLALAGLAWEAVADAQLDAHRRRGRGGLMTTGLWAWSRHPNYFGEAVFWWGLWLPAAGAGAAWTLVSPLLMTALLRWGSGVPLLERSLRDRPGWDDYARRVNAFWPWPPRG
jgi:steroid 5-alpha reductase family enzyme